MASNLWMTLRIAFAWRHNDILSHSRKLLIAYNFNDNFFKKWFMKLKFNHRFFGYKFTIKRRKKQDKLKEKITLTYQLRLRKSQSI